MALTENVSIDKIEVVGDWNIQVRQATIIEKDGEFVSRTFHRWVLTPDMDISDQEQKVQDIANAAWTPEVKAAYEAFKAEQANKLGV
jgi:TPP-dependent indolepyruvate ferredoxin oxidoreductase alpha subunit